MVWWVRLTRHQLESRRDPVSAEPGTTVAIAVPSWARTVTARPVLAAMFSATSIADLIVAQIEAN